MHLRPYQPQDISALADIMCLCNLTDPMARYQNKNMTKYWTSYRKGSIGALQWMPLNPGTICWVVETDEGDDVPFDLKKKGENGVSRGGDVIGWAIWSRDGKSKVARNWQRPGEAWATKIEATLLYLSHRYFAKINPTIGRAHRAAFQEAKPPPPDPEIFAECWELDGLYVSPSYQRRGAGTLLLQWGVAQAGAEGVPIVVKASPLGVELYEKWGFRSYERQDFDQLFETGGRGFHTLVWEPPGREGRWYERAKKKVEEEAAKKAAGKG